MTYRSSSAAAIRVEASSPMETKVRNLGRERQSAFASLTAFLQVAADGLPSGAVRTRAPAHSRPAVSPPPPSKPPYKPPPEADRLPMVGWFDPGQLVRTGVDVVISAIFARNSDRRVLDALS